MESAPINIVMTKRKSTRIPRPPTKQKLFKTGMSVSIPMKNTILLQMTVVKIDGPIFFIAKPMRSGISMTYGGISDSA